MTWSLWPFFIFLLYRPLLALTEGDLPTRIVPVGAERFISTPLHARIFLKAEGGLRLRDLGTKIEISALKAGQYRLRVADRPLTVLALPLPPATDTSSLEHEVQALKGLHIQYTNNQWEVSGELWRLKDWRTLHRVFAGTTYRFRARAEGTVAREARLHLFAEFRKRGIPLPQSSWLPPSSFEFGALTPAQKSAATELAERYGLALQVHDTGMALGPLVRLRVLIAEIHQSYLRELGLNWQSTYQAQVVPRWADQGGVFAELRNLESKGQGQVLAAPNLVCRSGGSAQFMAGGEFAVKLQGFRQQKVTWKRHGVLLQFRPVAEADGRMTLAMSVEISLIDPTQTVDGIPGLKINRIESQLNFLNNKTIVLSGLLKNQLGHSRDGLALLQQIPLLGALFRSQSYLENRTELVVFVTPSVEQLEGPSDQEAVPNGWRDLEEIHDS